MSMPGARRFTKALPIFAVVALATCSSGAARPSPTSTSASMSTPSSTGPAVERASTTVADAVATTSDLEPYLDPTKPIAVRTADLLARMTLPEKIGQMTQVDRSVITPAELAAANVGSVLSGGGSAPPTNSPASWAAMVDGYQRAALSTRLGIPMLYGIDAVHGHGSVYGATVFPHNIGLGAANDPRLTERIGRATAIEMSATGIRWDFAPVVAVPHDIRWGRTFEAYSEDVSIVTSLATAFIHGLQDGDGGQQPLSGPTDVLATPKHFIGDGGTIWGTSTTSNYSIDQGDTRMEEAELRMRYLPPYRAALDAGAASIMVSFSSWNGTKMHANRYLLTDVLKTELGFDGLLLSDWAGIDQIPGDYASDIVTAINAGIDMVMVPIEYQAFMAGLTAAVDAGLVTMARIDDAVGRILAVKFALGLFEHPFADRSTLAEVGSTAHRALAREAVQRSLVLLDNHAGVLPIDLAGGTILVGGAGADDIGLQSGGWTISGQGSAGNTTPGTTILQGIKAAAGAGTNVEFDPTGTFAGADPAAPPAEVGIVVLAEPPYSEGPGDRADLSLPAADREVLERMRARSEKLVVVLLSGRPLVVTDEIGSWDAFVAAWLPGTEGHGVADALFGDAPFTGRLPYAWPRQTSQLPFSDAASLTTGCEGPLFPRGFAAEDLGAPLLDCPDPPPG